MSISGMLCSPQPWQCVVGNGAFREPRHSTWPCQSIAETYSTNLREIQLTRPIFSSSIAHLAVSLAHAALGFDLGR